MNCNCEALSEALVSNEVTKQSSRNSNADWNPESHYAVRSNIPFDRSKCCLIRR